MVHDALTAPEAKAIRVDLPSCLAAVALSARESGGIFVGGVVLGPVVLPLWL